MASSTLGAAKGEELSAPRFGGQRLLGQGDGSEAGSKRFYIYVFTYIYIYICTYIYIYIFLTLMEADRRVLQDYSSGEAPCLLP